MTVAEELSSIKDASAGIAAEMPDCREDIETVESDVAEAITYASEENWSKAKWWVDSATRTAQSVQASASTPMQSSTVKTRLVEPLSEVSDALHQKDRAETTVDGRENFL